MTRDTEDVVARRGAIRDILYRLLPQEIDANICRAVADEFLALEASDRQSLSDRIDVLEGVVRLIADRGGGWAASAREALESAGK